MLKGKSSEQGLRVSRSRSIPRAKSKHSKPGLLNPVFVANVVLEMDSELSPESYSTRCFIHPQEKDSGSFAGLRAGLVVSLREQVLLDLVPDTCLLLLLFKLSLIHVPVVSGSLGMAFHARL